MWSFATGTESTTPTGNTGWQQHAANLSAWAGSTVRLVFRETVPEVYTGPGRIEFDAIGSDGIPTSPTNVGSYVPGFVAPAPPAQPAGVWQTYEIDLAAEAAARSLLLGPNFKIRFQQFDNQTYPLDGRGWDVISVVTQKAAGEYVLSIKGDG